MEMNKQEVAAVQATDKQVTVVQELQDCELILIGGGMGDISLG